MVLIFVIIEGALLMNAQITLDNAAREGARAGAVCGADATCINTIVLAVDDHLGIIPTSGPKNIAVVTCTSPGGSTNCNVVDDPSTCKKSSGTPYGGVARSDEVEVDLYARYDYYLGYLVGTASPSSCLSSKARAAP
jgi:Flp pilus assembly protein TadG